MTRVADAGHLTYYTSSDNYKLCKCYRIILADNTILAYTDHDQDLTVDLGDGYGASVYLADTVMDASELQNKTNVGTSNVDITLTLMEANSIDIEKVLLGQFDNAIIDIFEARWDVTPVTKMRGFCGLLSEAEVNDDQINITYRSLTGLYDQSVLRTVRRGCHYELGKHSFSFHRCFVQMTAPTWAATTAYTKRENYDAKTEIGAIVKPSVPGKFWYICTVAGTSGASEPTWPTTLGATVTDGTVTWKAIYARSMDGVVDSSTSRQQFTDAAIAISSGYWRYGYLVWNTGANAGRRVEIGSDNGSGVIQLFAIMRNTILAGDTYTIYAGCDHFKTTCISKFDNVYWFGGFDDAPGVLTVTQTPNVHSD